MPKKRPSPETQRARKAMREEYETMAQSVTGLGRPGKDAPKFDPVLDEGRRRWGRTVRSGTRPYLRPSKKWEAFLGPRARRTGRLQLARSWGRMLKQMEQTGQSMTEFVEGLSNEELIRGRLRDSRGSFQGRPPKWVPQEFHKACVRELMRRGRQLYLENYLGAIEAMTDIAKDPDADNKDRIRAAMWVVERIEGKIPEKLEVTVDKPWQVAIEAIVAQVPDDAVARAQASFVDGEVISEEWADEVAEVVDEAEEGLPSTEVVPAPRPAGRPGPAAARRGRRRVRFTE